MVKLGLNCPLVPLLKVIIHSHLAYNATFHPDAKFQLLVICCFRLYLKETIKFFWFRTQFGPFFEGLEAIALVKKHQIKMIFWPQVVDIVVQMSFKAFWKTRIFIETGRTHGLSFWSNFDESLRMAKIKNSHQATQVNQNGSPLSFQFSMKTIITFCSI